MFITATQIRVGMVLNVDGELYRVTWMQHVTPGKGVACMQTKLKSIISGKNSEKRYRSDERVEKAELRERNMQYLYDEQDGCVFMDTENFEQITLGDDILGEGNKFLTVEAIYPVSFYEGQPVGITLPNSVEVKVTVAPPEIKRATASAQMRPVTLENGMVVQAPAFIKEGDMIRINTETGEYMERVK